MHRDWSNAEYGIAAALAGDKKRWENYLYRDAYLVKAADFGFCDYTATKATHKELRNKFKPVTLAGQYGQTASGLAKVLGIPEKQAQTFIDREAKLYPAYQRWLESNAEDLAFNGYVETEFGFRLWVPYDTSKSLRSEYNGHLTRRAMNHPMQGNCAEIMRYACCLATERGIDLGCTIHDAVMYTGPEDSWEDVDAEMVRCMNEACEAVLGDGYILKSARDVVHFPDHYSHEDGEKMWNQIQAALIEAENAPPPPPLPPVLCPYVYDMCDMPQEFDAVITHQLGDVCGAVVTDGCKMCEDHCKKPGKCKVHKEPTVFDYEYVGG